MSDAVTSDLVEDFAAFLEGRAEYHVNSGCWKIGYRRAAPHDRLRLFREWRTRRTVQGLSPQERVRLYQRWRTGDAGLAKFFFRAVREDMACV